MTVDFTQEEEGILNPAQRTLDTEVILENHRDLVSWGKNTAPWNEVCILQLFLVSID